MPATIVLKNAFLIDCTGRAPMEGAAVVVEGRRIKHVIPSGKVGATPTDAATVDLKGQTLMPGLSDAHVHLGLVKMNVRSQIAEMPLTLTTLMAANRAANFLSRGYTTLRDACGIDLGVKLAAERGVIRSPRLLISGAAISQTGGHGDVRSRTQRGTELCQCSHGARVVDGVAAIQHAVRDELRLGADQIKIMAGGGVASPTDRIDSVQFSPEEIRAAVQEARRAQTYVMAHAHCTPAIQHAVKAGVRSIEHGTILDLETAVMMKRAGTFLVPTLLIIENLWRNGVAGGLSKEQMAKMEAVRGMAVESLRIAHQAGVKIALGTDYFGEMTGSEPARELELRRAVMAPMDILRSATQVNAQLFQLDDQLGTVEEGKLADLIVVDGNPLEDIAVFQNLSKLTLIMKDGEIQKNTLG